MPQELIDRMLSVAQNHSLDARYCTKTDSIEVEHVSTSEGRSCRSYDHCQTMQELYTALGY